MPSEFTPGYAPPGTACGGGLWVVMRGDRVLVAEAGPGAVRLPRLDGVPAWGLLPEDCHFLGRFAGEPCFAAAWSGEESPPAGLVWRRQRALLLLVPAAVYVLVGVARQVLDWDRHNRFCGACGTPTRARRGERAKECPACGLVRYPRLSPAVIMRVTDGKRVLLGRQAVWPAGMYSVLAGFVELGETLEEAVAREVREETGLAIANVRYFASQPWALPDSLMVGFTAEYAGGELKVDRAELEDAGWYPPEDLPGLPNPGTLSRALLDDYLRRLAG